MRRLLQDISIMLRANLWLVPVLAALGTALFYFVAPPPPMQLRMSTGFAGGGYAAFAQRLKAELARDGFELELVPSSGARENLARLLDEQADVQIGLVQSGLELQLDEAQRARLHSLGSVYQEPLWLFQRRDLNIDGMRDLLPLRLGLGGAGSGTAAVSGAILAANGITAEQYPEQWQARGGNKAADALLAGELDAAFFLGPAENALIQRLAAAPELVPVNFRRAAAYQARLPFVRAIPVGEGLLDLAANSPPADMITLAPAATLVVNDAFHPALTPLILAAAREVMKNGSLLDAPGAFPSAEPATFALLDEAAYFHSKGLPLLQRYLPFRIASLADRYIILVIPLLVVLIPLFKAVGPLYRWRIRARIYRWYKHLREIDRQLDAGTLPARLDAEIEHLEKLEEQLARVEVPLAYSNELYQLHLHLRYVIERLQALQQRQSGG
jgi:TRAP-type uncharacterized transport system substrate-binding protein